MLSWDCPFKPHFPSCLCCTANILVTRTAPSPVSLSTGDLTLLSCALHPVPCFICENTGNLSHGVYLGPVSRPWCLLCSDKVSTQQFIQFPSLVIYHRHFGFDVHLSRYRPLAACMYYPTDLPPSACCRLPPPGGAPPLHWGPYGAGPPLAEPPFAGYPAAVPPGPPRQHL